MQNELKAVKNTINGIQRIHRLTDDYTAKIRELGERQNAKAKAAWRELESNEIDHEEYDRRMNAIDREQRIEGERIEKSYVAAARGNSKG